MSSELRDKTIGLLEGCIKGLDDWNLNQKKVTERNTIRTNFNNEQTKRWGIAYKIWKEREKIHNDRVEDWRFKRGDFLKYKNYGEKEEFNARWGWEDWDWNNFCRQCASGQFWGEGNKTGGAWCEGTKPNQNLSSYYIYEGRHGLGNRRYDWTCVKNEYIRGKENTEYNNLNPGAFTEPEPKDKQGDYAHQQLEQNPQSLSLNCCANVVNVLGEASNIQQTCEQSIKQNDPKKISDLIKEINKPSVAEITEIVPQVETAEPIQTIQPSQLAQTSQQAQPVIESQKIVEITDSTKERDYTTGTTEILIFIVIILVVLNIFFLMK